MWFLDCNSNFPLIHEKIENWDLLMLLYLGFSIFSNLWKGWNIGIFEF